MNANSSIVPVFLFGLPRSGTTLLQRILMCHDTVQSTPEPWVLFPYILNLNSDGVVSKYSSNGFSRALNKFLGSSKFSREQYLETLRKHVSCLYESQCEEKHKFFIDKTPRYFYYIDEIVSLFPDAKFIFLFRNPLGIYNSILNTFCKGRFRFFPRYYHDIYTGFGLMSKAFERHKSNSISIRFEDLINNPENSMKELCRYLDLEFDPSSLKRFADNKFERDTMGDPTGQYEYSKLEKRALKKWDSGGIGFLRLAIMKSFIRGINENEVQIQGYSRDELLKELNENSFELKGIIRDGVDIISCWFILKFKINLLFGKDKSKWFLS